MGKVLTGLFVGIFVGALTYELVRRTGVADAAARKASEGLESASRAFKEGYYSGRQTPEECASTA